MLSDTLFGEHACKTILLVLTQSLSLADKNAKVNAVECDFYVFILYRIHLNFLPIVIISNLCITIYY